MWMEQVFSEAHCVTIQDTYLQVWGQQRNCREESFGLEEPNELHCGSWLFTSWRHTVQGINYERRSTLKERANQSHKVGHEHVFQFLRTLLHPTECQSETGLKERAKTPQGLMEAWTLGGFFAYLQLEPKYISPGARPFCDQQCLLPGKHAEDCKLSEGRCEVTAKHAPKETGPCHLWSWWGEEEQHRLEVLLCLHSYKGHLDLCVCKKLAMKEALQST